MAAATSPRSAPITPPASLDLPTSRDMRLDALRGLFLIIMAAVHVPTPWSHWLQEPFGYLSAAEGFIFLGACLAGFVYAKVRRKHGARTMARRVWARARKIYLVHLALVVTVSLIAWPLASRLVPLANHFHDFLQNPPASLLLMPLLLHQPPLFDILPLYVVFLGVTPLAFALARKSGWTLTLSLSAALWMLAQFHPLAHFTDDSARLLPMRLGSFNLLGWQFLWVAGLATGETLMRRPASLRRSRRWLILPALIVVLAGLLFRHRFGLQPVMVPDFAFWTDKWRLGPLRVLNSVAWAVLLWSSNPRLPRWLLAPPALLGRHSLAVFSLHIPLAIIAATAIQTGDFSFFAQLVIGAAVIAAMFLFAARLDRGHPAGHSPSRWWHRLRARFALRSVNGAVAVSAARADRRSAPGSRRGGGA